MTRKPGSGLSYATASAVERLVAASFEGSSTDRPLRDVDAEWRAGLCGVPAKDLARWISQIVSELDLPVVAAQTPSPDLLGDVRLTMADGTFLWIEVKAQTTKRFDELVQADWVRDATDALRFLRLQEPNFTTLLSPWMLDELDVANPGRHFGNMTFSDLWASDIGLVSDRSRRLAAGIDSAESLRQFLERKFILHVSIEGARIARLDRLRAVEHVLSGASVHIDVRPGRACEAIVWVGARPPSRGEIDFIYYVGYGQHGVVGRHKLHDRALRSAHDLIVVG